MNPPHSSAKDEPGTTVVRSPSGRETISGRLWPMMFSILFACLLNAPVLLWGLQFGHDHNLHITYLHFFELQLRAGELYPRWISGLNFGAGSPIFFVQYPLPYFAAAMIHWAIRIPDNAEALAHAFGIFFFLTGVVGSVSAWLWCSKLSNRWAGFVASVAFVSMPYFYGCDVYFRGAVGEYSALAWLPLTLYFAHEVGEGASRAVPRMALAFALVILSNLFTAILFAPFLFSYAIVIPGAIPRRVKTGLQAGSAILLGGLIAAVYLLPMNQHRLFFSGENLNRLRDGIFDSYSYLFPLGGKLFPESDLAAQIVSVLSIILGLAIVAFLLSKIRKLDSGKLLAAFAAVFLFATLASPLVERSGLLTSPDIASARVLDVRSRVFLITFLTLETGTLAFLSLVQYRILPGFLFVSTLLCYFLETRWSSWIWQELPLLRNVQFPWRLSGPLSVFVAGLFAIALRDVWERWPRRLRIILYGGAVWLFVGLGTYFALNIPQIVRRPFFTEIRSRLDSAFPAYARVLQLPPSNDLGPQDGLESGAVVIQGQGTARVDVVDGRHRRLEMECMTPCIAQLRLVFYPFWQAKEGAELIPVQPGETAGLTTITVSPGKHSISLELPLSRAEVLGAWISAVSFGCVLLMILFGAPRMNRPQAVTASD